jgi:hypothetical protein
MAFFVGLAQQFLIWPSAFNDQNSADVGTRALCLVRPWLAVAAAVQCVD